MHENSEMAQERTHEERERQCAVAEARTGSKNGDTKSQGAVV